ncbi:MAG: flavodoxin family protein [Armatimonadetes bacterium]|nr:flavodoxin family protein [Armatimonadota bacterium]
MALLLGLLTSGRRSGYTAGLLDAALGSASEVEGLTVERVAVQSFRFGPCTSCFACIRREEHVCVLDDDMGREGAGELFAKVASANALLIVDPVHNWGPSATCHLLIERLYPFLWSGQLSGMPFASISCASNQGMHRLATQNLCKWAFGLGMRYVRGLAAHCAAYAEAQNEARRIGTLLAEAALSDAREGRCPMTDSERFLSYAESPWVAFEPYLDNLTSGTGEWEQSLVQRGLSQGTFKRPEARELLEQALEKLKRVVALKRLGNLEGATQALVEASAAWTHATWKEFLEEEVIGAPQPEAYRPLT